MRVVVCGSRTFTDDAPVVCVLAGLLARTSAKGETLTVIEGAANGADALARTWAERWPRGDQAVAHERYPADWASCAPECRPGHRRSGRSTDTYCPLAGHRRNQQMLDEGRPDLVVAFVDKPLAESKGTADMVRRARKAGVPTYVVEAQR